MPYVQEEEESFGSMRRLIFAKGADKPAAEKEKNKKEKDEAVGRTLRALKTTVGKIELRNIALETADVKLLCDALKENKTIKFFILQNAALDGSGSGRIAGALWESRYAEKKVSLFIFLYFFLSG
jgi:hypothetical protein